MTGKQRRVLLRVVAAHPDRLARVVAAAAAEIGAERVGCFTRGSSRPGGGNPRHGEVAVDVCFRCGAAKTTEGSDLCIWCEEPASLAKGPVVFDGDYHEHRGCKEQWEL